MVVAAQELSSETSPASIIRGIVRKAIQNVEDAHVCAMPDTSDRHTQTASICSLRSDLKHVAPSQSARDILQESPVAQHNASAFASPTPDASFSRLVHPSYDRWPGAVAAFAASAWASLVRPQCMHVLCYREFSLERFFSVEPHQPHPLIFTPGSKHMLQTTQSQFYRTCVV